MEHNCKKYEWPLVGNREITAYLEKSIENGRLSGAYIFSGPDNLGKTTAAKNFAKILLCQGAKPAVSVDPAPCGSCQSCRQFRGLGSEPLESSGQAEIGAAHSDFHILKKDRDKKNIAVEQVRDFIMALSLSSFFGGYKIGIIKHADSLSQGAANALLKTLEEPKPKVVIILIAESAENLPATILSRCQILRFRAVDSDIIYDYLVQERGVGRNQARELSRLSLGRPALAAKFLENSDSLDFYRRQAMVFLNFAEQSLGERFAAIDGLFESKLGAQESAGLAKRILQAWQGVLRDYLLAFFGHNNLVQHQAELEYIKINGRRATPAGLARLYGLMKRSEEQIEANVNPKLALEGVAVEV